MDAALEWVNWFHTTRRFGPIGYISPDQAETDYYESLNTVSIAEE